MLKLCLSSEIVYLNIRWHVVRLLQQAGLHENNARKCNTALSPRRGHMLTPSNRRSLTIKKLKAWLIRYWRMGYLIKWSISLLRELSNLHLDAFSKKTVWYHSWKSSHSKIQLITYDLSYKYGPVAYAGFCAATLYLYHWILTNLAPVSLKAKRVTCLS